MTEVILKKPVFNPAINAQIDKVTINEPTGKQLKDAYKVGGKMDTQALQSEFEHTLFGYCTGLPSVIIEQFSVTDLGKIATVVRGFLSGETE
jgi:Phage tail assembly chaperone proteins, E, or 41 or 14